MFLLTQAYKYLLFSVIPLPHPSLIPIVGSKRQLRGRVLKIVVEPLKHPKPLYFYW